MTSRRTVNGFRGPVEWHMYVCRSEVLLTGLMQPQMKNGRRNAMTRKWPC